MNKSKFSIKPASLILGFSIIAILAGTYFLAIPQAKALREKTKELKTKEAQLSSLEERKRSLIALGNALPTYRRQIDRLAVAYPKESQAVEALLQLQTMADRSGVAIVTMSPGKAKGGGLPVSMQLRSSYGALNVFLGELYTNIRPIALKAMSVTTAGKEGSFVTTNLSLEFASSAVGSTVPAPAISAAPEELKK